MKLSSKKYIAQVTTLFGSIGSIYGRARELGEPLSKVSVESVYSFFFKNFLLDYLPHIVFPYSGKETLRVFGGSEAKDSRYPYAQVSLQQDGEHYCGGTLVARDMVLTAAHCLGSFNAIEFHRFNLSDNSESFETLGILDVYVHRLYSSWTDRFDAMLVKLDGIVSQVEPIRINDSADLPEANKKLTVVGWGATDYTDDGDFLYPDKLQETNVFYIPNSICELMEDEHGTSLRDRGWLYADMMCAGDRGKDSCSGDSGSPLIARGDSPENDIQFGIVSWGFTCAGPIPGIYSRTSSSYNWIRSKICSHSDFLPGYMKCDSPAPIKKPPTVEPSRVPSSPPSDLPSTSFDATPTTPPTAFLDASVANASEPVKLLGDDQADNSNQQSSAAHSPFLVLSLILTTAIALHANEQS